MEGGRLDERLAGRAEEEKGREREGETKGKGKSNEKRSDDQSRLMSINREQEIH